MTEPLATNPAPERVWAAFAEGHHHGYLEGFERGAEVTRAEIAEAEAAAWARMREHVRMLANLPKYADLCEKRGEHEKAAANRALLRERGIS